MGLSETQIWTLVSIAVIASSVAGLAIAIYHNSGNPFDIEPDEAFDPGSLDPTETIGSESFEPGAESLARPRSAWIGAEPAGGGFPIPSA